MDGKLVGFDPGVCFDELLTTGGEPRPSSKLLVDFINGLPEGELVTIRKGIGLFITYQGGDGNDITLFAVAICSNAPPFAERKIWKDTPIGEGNVHESAPNG